MINEEIYTIGWFCIECKRLNPGLNTDDPRKNFCKHCGKQDILDEDMPNNQKKNA